jgi:hypothetical protein
VAWSQGFVATSFFRAYVIEHVNLPAAQLRIEDPTIGLGVTDQVFFGFLLCRGGLRFAKCQRSQLRQSGQSGKRGLGKRGLWENGAWENGAWENGAWTLLSGENGACTLLSGLGGAPACTSMRQKCAAPCIDAD